MKNGLVCGCLYCGCENITAELGRPCSTCKKRCYKEIRVKHPK